MIGTSRTQLDALPKPEVIEELDFEVIRTRMRDKTVELEPTLAPIIDLESEPVNIQQQAAAYSEMLTRADKNEAYRQRLLAFATGGGLDHLAYFYDLVRLPGEDDERFRERTVLAIQGRSTGGPAERYRLVALSAGLGVRDAIVYREGRDPTINIAIYSDAADGTADQALLDQVQAYLDDPENAVRLVNDRLVVRSAVTRQVAVTADIWLKPSADERILSALPGQVMDKWHNDEGGLGADLLKVWLASRLMVPGIHRVEITAPLNDEIVPPYEAVAISNITLSVRGRDD